MRARQCRKTMGRAGRDGLFVFQALIASSALASSGQGSGQAGATTIICTASGPRVVALDSEDAAQHASQQGGALPQCCTAGCAMPGGITPPALFLYSWLAPVIHHAAPAPAAAPISPAPWRDCRSGRARRLPPDARYPNETDSRPDRGGHVYRLCGEHIARPPACFVAARIPNRAWVRAQTCARFPAERQAMSGGTPFIQGPGEFPCSENH